MSSLNISSCDSQKKNSLPNNKGIVLFIVLGTILLVSILANVVLSIIVTQRRLSFHQASRIQAYYAAQAGANYAIEMLRTGVWSAPAAPPASTFDLCRAAAATTGCGGSSNDVYSSGLTHDVTVQISPLGIDLAGVATVSARVNYTFN